jgi:hypothetical protein
MDLPILDVSYVYIWTYTTVTGFFPFSKNIFLVGQGFHACKVGTVLLEPHLQPILLQLFWRWNLKDYLPGLASNHNPPDLSLPSS